MKLDKKVIFSIFIVLMFVGSIFAIMTYGSGRDNVSDVEDLNGLVDLNQEPISYQSQFDANVSEIFSQIIIAGTPIDYDTTSVENKLLDISGIKKKSIAFNQLADGNISIIITLNISADKKQEIIDGVKALNVIEEPIEVYQYGLLSVPEDINFTNDNNESINYAFSGPMEGIVNISTEKGDNISAVCYATFVSNKLVNARGIEMQNNTASPQMLFSEKEFEIIGFEPTIYLTTDINSDDNETIDILESNLGDYNFEINKDSEKLTIIFSEENVNITEINKIFTDNNLDTNANKYQKLATVDTSNLEIEGKAYNYAETTTQVLLDYPEDLNKETVELTIQGYYQRDTLLYLGLSK